MHTHMAKKLPVILRKGGSGKSTTAINLATALHLMGKNVLLVDLDPQANATLSVGIDPTSLPTNINHLFTSIQTRPEDVITRTEFGLSILPAHPDLAKTEAGMTSASVGEVRALLTPLDDAFDVIVIDTPPSEGYLTVSALVAANEVIIPLQAHYLALQGLDQALTQVDQVRKGLNPTIKVAGILPTLVNARTNISKTVIEEVRRSYPQLLYPIGIEYSVKHSEASLAGKPIVLYDPTHQGSIAYMQLAERFV